MSLVTICRNALNEITGWEVPSTYFGNNNLTAKACLNLLERAGKSLERRHRWLELIAEHTFVTVNGTASYALPDDFRAFANASAWDRTNYNPMLGPIGSGEWQFLKSSVAGDTGTITRWFRVKGALLYVHPTPTVDNDTIAFDYYSKNWITDISAANAAVAAFTADGDTTLLDEDLLTQDLKWRFLQAKGMPFEAELIEWQIMRDVRLASYGGARVLSMSDPIIGRVTNIPEADFPDA